MNDKRYCCNICGEHHSARVARIQRPKIVVLCGSTRFRDEFAKQNYLETMKGNIVLSVGFYVHADECPSCGFTANTKRGHVQGKCWSCGHDLGCTSEQKLALDELHKRKIDLADEVFVLNVDGYMGKSTLSEVAYAVNLEKPIRFLEAR